MAPSTAFGKIVDKHISDEGFLTLVDYLIAFPKCGNIMIMQPKSISREIYRVYIYLYTHTYCLSLKLSHRLKILTSYFSKTYTIGLIIAHTNLTIIKGRTSATIFSNSFSFVPIKAGMYINMNGAQQMMNPIIIITCSVLWYGYLSDCGLV